MYIFTGTLIPRWNVNKPATVLEDRATLSQLEFALGHFTATVSFVTGSDCEKRFEC